MPRPESVQVDKYFYEMLASFSKIAEDEKVPWLLVGATARILLLENVYGWTKGVATADTDFAVQVASWEHYETLCEQLIKQGNFKPLQRPTKRFVSHHDILFDLLPYGGVETGIKQVYWPPNNDYLMTVRGFDSAHNDAIKVEVNNKLDVPVISPRAFFALKMFAWEERHSQHPGRDAKDLAYLIQNIESLYSAEILHTQHPETLEKNEYDFELAALSQFGETVKELLMPKDNEFLRLFLNKEVDQEDDSPFVREIYRYLPTKNIERVVTMLRIFYKSLS